MTPPKPPAHAPTSPAAEPAAVPLSELLAHQPISLAEVLAWAADIATSLSCLHAAGTVHGAVSTLSICIRERHATLSTCATPPDRTRWHDVVQFGEALRTMIVAASLQPAASAKQKHALTSLENLAARFLQPKPGAYPAEMKKVALAVRLLCLEVPLPRAPVPVPAPRQRKVLLLIRIVPSQPAAAQSCRKRLSFWPTFTLMVVAASLVTAAAGALFCAIR